jgi:hypothetical protein
VALLSIRAVASLAAGSSSQVAPASGGGVAAQSMRLRYRGCANRLNRSTLRTEKALDKRLDDELPAAPTEMAEPVDDTRQAEIMAAIQQYKRRSTPNTPAPTPPPACISRQPRRGTPNSGLSAMLDALQQQGAPVQPSP